MINMSTSKQGMAELAGHEGLCQSKYKDSVGVWTVGIGATRTEIADIANWPMDKKLSIEECFTLFQKSLKHYEIPLNKALIKEIPQNWYDALVSWLYNVGIGWIKKGSVIEKVNGGASASTVANALLQYMKPPEIKGRRQKEALLLKTGKYSNNGKVNVFPVNSSGHPQYNRGKIINVMEYLN